MCRKRRIVEGTSILSAGCLTLLLLAGCGDSVEPQPQLEGGAVHSEQPATDRLSSTAAFSTESVAPEGSHAEQEETSPAAVVPSELALSENHVLAAESVVASPTEVPPAAALKAKREPIYIEESNGKELIAAAVRKAQRDHKHVLIEWGGNWCGWCYKLHDVFHNDAAVEPIVYEEFVLVLIDSNTNHDLMLEYGGADRQYSFPHLTVLDDQGSVLTNQNTEPLEEGSRHDPKLVAEFLHKWVPEKIDAEQLLSESLQQAESENKHVLVRVGSPYCGWCHVLSQFVQDHEALFATDYVDIKIDTKRMEHGAAVAERLAHDRNGGIPWMVILDPSGKEVASSFGPDGNVGYPYQPHEIAYFVDMLRQTRRQLTDAELDTIATDLNAFREQRESRE